MLAAGSRYETRDTNGIAHFAEHMFFKGTERRPTARDIAGEIDSIGGEFNAFTGKEYTGYYVKCAAEHARHRARRARRHAPPLEVRPGGDRAREGRDHRGDEHVLRHAARLHRRRLRDAPLRRPAARLGHHRPQGDRARRDARDVPRLPRALVQAAADGRRRRRPRRRRPARAAIEELLGDLPAETTRRAGAASRSHANGRVQGPHEDVRPGAPRASACRATRSSTRTATRCSCSSTVLGGGMSSRLFTEVRERRGLAYYVFAANHSYTDAGSLYSQAGVDINRIDEAVETIVGELQRIADEPVPADELEKARNVRQGPVRAPAREPAGDDHVRPAARGARGPGDRAGGGARRPRRGHRPRTSSASRRT